MEVDYVIKYQAIGKCTVCGKIFTLDVTDPFNADGAFVECDCGNGMKLEDSERIKP